MTDPFRSFYQQHLPDLSAITDLPHRHFRILLPRGTFLKLQDQVRSEEVLRKWLVRYRPSDVYYSTSCWLVPREPRAARTDAPLRQHLPLVGYRLRYRPVAVLGSKPRTGTAGYPAAARVLRRDHLAVKYIAFSGSKGFHVICADPRRYDDPSPLVREDRAKAARREIIARVLAEGIAIDTKITADTRRIIRVPGTINSKTGYVCTVLSREQLSQPVSTILKYIPRVNAGTPMIPARGDESPLRGTRIISWLCHRFGVRSKPISRFSYSTFLVSSVPGTPLQVPLFTFPPYSRMERVESRLTAVQQQYGLSDIYLYRSGTGICRHLPADVPDKEAREDHQSIRFSELRHAREIQTALLPGR